MASVDILLSLSEQLSRIVGPLEASLDSEADFTQLLRRVGWDIDPTSFTIAPVRGSIGIATDLQTASSLFDEISSADDFPPLDKYVELLETLRSVVSDLRSLSGTTAPAGLPADVWTTFTAEIVDVLLAAYLERSHSFLYAVLLAGGVIDEVVVDAGGAVNRVTYVRPSFSWDRLETLLTEPAKLAKDVYGWDPAAATLDAGLVVGRLGRSVSLIGLPVTVAAPPASRLDQFYSPGNPARAQLLEVDLTLLAGTDRSGNSLDARLYVLPIPEVGDTGGPPRGILLGPSVTATATPPTDLFGSLYSIALAGSGGLATFDGPGIELRPSGVTASAVGQTKVDASAKLSRENESPDVLVGSIFSHRLELYAIAFGLSVRGALPSPEVALDFEISRARLVIDASDFDGFLGSVLADVQPVELAAGLTWSSKTGFHVSAGGGLAIVIPLNLSLSVVELRSITLAGVTRNGEVELAAGLTGDLKLGPVAVSVDNVGADVVVTPVAQGQTSGVFGDLDFRFGFKPPDGLGLEVDAVAIKGGGYIFFNDAKKEYAGVLELSLEDTIQLKVIGILDTILPGGQPGFSLLLIITAEFEPIQLGFGFTLNGVGGLAGINRTMLLDVLRAGLRNRTLDSILFPPDPIANAPKIISDLSAIFPPVQGRYAFGPQLKIGWGTPTLITAAVGVFIELPPPIRLAILAQIKAALPTEDEALIEINMDAIGTYEQEKKRLAVDATLYDSQIVGFTLTGDMAMRLTWGDQPFFALSLGGFNPRYSIPSGVEFPQLHRLELSMGSGGVRLDLATYFAVTSNTAQLGAHLELRVGNGAGLHGWMGFDALFVFTPFSFVVDISAGVDLVIGGASVMTIHLNFTLSGPTPWHAWGEASIDFFFFSISVPFNVRWGSDQGVALPAVDVRTPLLAAFADPRNWTANAPVDRELAATLRAVAAPKIAGSDAVVILAHPFARLTVRERLVPLDVRIDKFGNATPDKWNQFRIVSGQLNAATLTPQTLQDYFARAQFIEMSNDEKLARPSFELLDAGAALGSNDVRPGYSSPLQVHYETFIIDDLLLQSRRGPLYRLAESRFIAQTGLGAAGRSKVWTSGPRKYIEPDATSAVGVSEPQYLIAGIDDLVSRPDLLAMATSRLEAEQRLGEHLAARPADRDRLQVVPANEAVV
jgi:hypothetical protein